MKKIIISAGVVASMLLASCSDEIEMRRPPVYELPELPVVEGIHQYKAPLYWSVYEYCYTREQAGVANSDMDITPTWTSPPSSGTRSSTGLPPS